MEYFSLFFHPPYLLADRDLDPAEVEAFNDDVMKDVIKEKSQNPPRYR